MHVIPLADIRPALSFTAAIDAVKEIFIDYSKGLIEQPEPMQILFKESNGAFFGDCHVKAAQHTQQPFFVIKVASGFYQNTAKGLPANNGLVLVMSAQTGVPVALLQDEGWLTQVRTAAAGALAASLKPVSKDACLGLVGAGTQAYLQAQMISHKLGIKKVAIYARNLKESQSFKQRLEAESELTVEVMQSVREVCHTSQILVTATPSSTALVHVEDLPKELHIVAVGADSPGKSEIAPEVLANADILVTDNHEQCLHHGDFGNAVRAGAIAEDSDVELGHLLAGKRDDIDFAKANISVVDLTGIGAQDLAVASVVVNKLAL